MPADVFQDIPSVAVADLYRRGAWRDDRPTRGGGMFGDGATVEWSLVPSEDRVFGVATITSIIGASFSGEVAIDISWSPCNFGGRRAWFHCPGCDGRTSRLFIKDHEFRCRNCAKVSYKSQHQSAELRKLERAAEIRVRLWGLPRTGAPFPEKPARMHLNTYCRLRDEALTLEKEVQIYRRVRYFTLEAAGRGRSAMAVAGAIRSATLSEAEADAIQAFQDAIRAKVAALGDLSRGALHDRSLGALDGRAYDDL